MDSPPAPAAGRHGWARRIAETLDELEAVQLDFRTLHSARRDAFRAADAARLAATGRTEAELVGRLRTVVHGRERLLADARRAGLEAASLANLAIALDVDRAILRRIEAASKNSARLQREAWAQWVTARRGAAVTTEMLERVVHRGRAAPTYEDRPADRNPAAAAGGSLLDAAA